MLQWQSSAASPWSAQWDAQPAARPLLVQAASVDSHSQQAAVCSAIKAVSPAQPPIPTSASPACPAKIFFLASASPALTPTAPTAKPITNFAPNANQDTLQTPMEHVAPAPLTA